MNSEFNKIQLSIQNFEQALSRLTQFIEEPIENDRDKAGIIQAFEFTFELAWKTFQKVAIEEQLENGGPRTIIKHAFSLNLVTNADEQIWLQMLDDRNLTTHTYRQLLADKICERIIKNYQNAFSDALSQLKLRCN